MMYNVLFFFFDISSAIHSILILILKVRITHRFAVMRGSSCNEATVDGETLRTLIGGSFLCQTGCSGMVGDTLVYCTDFSVTDNWSAGERAYTYTFNTTLSYFEAM